MDIYIDVPKVAQIVSRQSLVLKDICKVYCSSKNIQEQVYALDIYYIKDRKAANYTVSIMEIIERVLKEESFSDLTINCIGEKNVMIAYLPEVKKPNKILEYLLVAFIGCVIFFGSMVALMSFQVETNMTELISETCKILVGEELYNSYYVSVPYAVGISTGIIVFFNHFGGKKITTDPTPIEIEMFSFDKEIIETVVQQLELEKVGDGNYDK